MRITVENALPELLAERRVPSASEFARRLAPYLGKTLSTSQITRYMHDPPPSFDLKFIEAACNVLVCLPADLFKVRIECGPDDDLSALGTLSRRVDVVRAGASPAPPAPPAPPASSASPAPAAPRARSAHGTDARAPSAGDKPAEGRHREKASIHTGPPVDLFPIGRK